MADSNFAQKKFDAEMARLLASTGDNAKMMLMVYGIGQFIEPFTRFRDFSMKHTDLVTGIKKQSTALVTIKANYGPLSAIFAHVFARCNRREAMAGGIADEQEERGEFEISNVFFSLSGTFDSADGEYRRRVLPFAIVQRIFEEHEEAMGIIEDIVQEEIDNGVLTFHTNFYYPWNVPRSKEYESEFKDTRLAINLYILTWLVSYHAIVNNFTENHIDKHFALMFGQDEDEEIYNEVAEKLQLNKNIEVNLNALSTKIKQARDMFEIGMKKIPMTRAEAIKEGDIFYETWREVHFNEVTSDLTMNLISTSFPLHMHRIIIHGSNPTLFDNPNMHEKFKNDTIARTIVNRLREADMDNYLRDESDPTMAPLWRDSKFKEVSLDVNNAIFSAQRDIVLSDGAVCIFSEYLGHTFADILEDPSVVMRTANVFGDLTTFKGLMFEYIYSLFCMNHRLAVMHGDLHANNFAVKLTKPTPQISLLARIADEKTDMDDIFEKYARMNVNNDPSKPRRALMMFTLDTTSLTEDIPLPHSMTLKDEAWGGSSHDKPGSLHDKGGPRDREGDQTWVYVNCALQGTIFDFSRAISGNVADIRTQCGSSTDVFFSEQNKRVLIMIERVLPEFYAKYSAQLKNMLNHQTLEGPHKENPDDKKSGEYRKITERIGFPDIFIVLTGCDLYQMFRAVRDGIAASEWFKGDVEGGRDADGRDDVEGGRDDIEGGFFGKIPRVKHVFSTEVSKFLNEMLEFIHSSLITDMTRLVEANEVPRKLLALRTILRFFEPINDIEKYKDPGIETTIGASSNASMPIIAKHGKRETWHKLLSYTIELEAYEKFDPDLAAKIRKLMSMMGENPRDDQEYKNHYLAEEKELFRHKEWTG